MRVFWFELKSLRVFTVMWTLALAALASLYISVYPSFSREATQMKQVFESMPPAIRSGIGLDPDLMFSFLGFFTNVVHFIILGGAIMAAVLGLAVFSRERRAKTTDFLLSKPLRRGTVFAGKYLAGVLLLTVTAVVLTTVIYMVARLVDAGSVDVAVFGRIMLSFWLVQLWFYTVAGLLAVLFRLKTAPSGSGLALAAGLFLVGMVGGMIDLAKTRWVSPFKYIDLAYVLQHGTFETRYVWYMLIWIVVAGMVAALIWTRRDVLAEA